MCVEGCVWEGEGGKGRRRRGKGEVRKEGGQILQLHARSGTLKTQRMHTRMHVHAHTHTHTHITPPPPHTHPHQAQAWPQELPPPGPHATSTPRRGQNMEGGNNCELSEGHGCPDWRERRRERGKGGRGKGGREGGGKGEGREKRQLIFTFRCIAHAVTMTTVHHSLSPEQLPQYVMQKDVSLWVQT